MNLTGQFLISMPSLEDDRFEKTVIYMCAHSKDGAMGIIINKKIDYDLYPDLLEQLGIDKPLEDKKLYIRYGGPVESGRGFVLHSDEVIQKEDLSKGNGPKNSILALGYAGWGPGQIEKELASNSWMTLKANSDFIFDEKVNNKWNDAFNLLGIDASKLSIFSGSC